MFVVTLSISGLPGLDHVAFVHSAIPQINAMPRFKKIPLQAACRGLSSLKRPAGCTLKTSVLDDFSVR